MAAAPAPDAAAFAGHFSLEATRPTAAEIAALAQIVPPATPVYVSAVPTVTRQEIIAAAASLRKAGLEPIIHVAARRLASAADLQQLLSGLRGDADVRQLLVIGGDVDAPGGFADALAVIQKAACVRPASRRSESAPIRKAIRVFRLGSSNPHSMRKLPRQRRRACAFILSASSRSRPNELLPGSGSCAQAALANR